MNLVDEARLRYLGILITELWGDIICGYRAMGRILNRENDSSGISDADNNADTDVVDTSGTGDGNGTNGPNNNSNSKNSYTKASFSTYNIADANTNPNVDNTTAKGDVGGIGNTDNNFDGKNAHTKLVLVFTML